MTDKTIVLSMILAFIGESGKIKLLTVQPNF